MNRRALLVQGLSACAASLLPGAAYAKSAKGDKLHDTAGHSISVDMHSHIPPDATPASFPLKVEMQRAGLTALCASFPVDVVPRRAEGDWYRVHVEWAANLRALLRATDVREILSLHDLETCHRDGEPGVMQAAEGAQFLEGRIDRLAEAYGAGLRHLQLAHSVQDPIDPLGDLQTLEPRFGGLTDFGRRVIAQSNKLGMVVDLAHSSGKALKDALQVSTVPLVVSHTALLSPAGLGSVPTWSDTRLPMRLLRPDEARAVAEAGGVIGVWHIFPSMQAYAGGIIDLVKLVGVDHVGIGSDTGIAGAMYPANRRWADQRGGFFNALRLELRRQGCHPVEIEKVLGGNYCRVLRAVEQAAQRT